MLLRKGSELDDEKPYSRVAKYLQNKYGINKTNTQIKQLLHKISRKIADTYTNSYSKACSKCKVHKNANQFGKDRRNNDGLKSICKECDNLSKKK